MTNSSTAIPLCRAQGACWCDSQECFKAFFEKSLAVQLLIDHTDGSIAAANAAAVAFYGYPLSQMKHKKIHEINILSPAEVRAAMADAAAGQRNFFRFRHRLSSGDIRDVEVYSNPVDIGGKTLLHSIVHDITAHRQAEEAIIQQKQNIIEINRIAGVASATLDLDEVLNLILRGASAAVNASVGMIFLKVPDSDYLIWGAALGLSEAFVHDIKNNPIQIGEGLTGTIALTGQPIYIPVNSSGDSRVVRSVIRREGLNSFLGVPILAGCEIIGVMNILTHLPDRLCRNAIPICSAIGSQVGLAVRNARLYAVQKETEAALRESHAKMQALAESAQAANIAKSAFLANMSHELRTPFNGIMGILQLLQASPLNAEQRELVNMGIQSSERFTRLLADILDLSSMETGKMAIIPAPFSLQESLKAVWELFSASARNKGVRLICDADAAIPAHVLGDAIRVRQILFNLVGNALKFTSQGSVRVRLTPLSAAKGGDLRILFSISDTGIGIPDDKLRELFSPFVQADSSFTRSYQGAGLGLAIVRRLVNLMSGNISVESVVGLGTAIHVMLPFGLPAEAAAAPRPSPSPATAQRPLNILLAEDDPVNQLIMTAMVKKLGHTVTLADNGKTALGLLADNDYDCILMDIQMPVMTGLEATQAIRNSDAPGIRRDIPIIAVTAHTLPGDRERFLEAGMDGYLPKPVQLEDLKEMLKTFFEQV